MREKESSKGEWKGKEKKKGGRRQCKRGKNTSGLSLKVFEADFLKHLKEFKATRTVVDCIN